MRSRLLSGAVACLLVAAGIALGAGPLQGSGARDGSGPDRLQAEARDARIAELEAQVDLGSAYTGTTAARTLAGRLANRKVALVTFPGTDRGTVDLLAGLLRAAGATVTARVGVGETLLSASSSGLVEALSSQMLEQIPGVASTPGSGGYERIGALLARAVGVPPSARAASAPYDATAISLVAGLQAAKLIAETEVSARAGLAVAVLPATSPGDAASPVVDLLRGFGAQIPTVVTGPGADGVDGQPITLLRTATSDRLSTSLGADTSVGRVIAVLALAARTRGVVGDFGSPGGTDGPVAVPPEP